MLLITLLLIPLIGIFIISTIGAGAKASASYSDNGEVSSLHKGNEGKEGKESSFFPEKK